MKLLKYLKYLLYAAAGLLLLVIVAAVALLAFFDPNPFKPQIELAAREALQRSLRLEGDIRLAFYPSLGVSLGKATLSEYSSDQVFASIDSAHISVAVLPLLRGAIVVDEVRIAGLNASVVRRRDGTTNIDDLLGGRPGEVRDGAPGAAAGKAPAEQRQAVFDISGVRIERSAFAYRDERSAQELAVSDLSLRTGRIASDIPGGLRVAAALKGRNPNVDAKLEFAANYRFNVASGSFALTGLEAKASGDFPGVTGLALGARGDLAARNGMGEYSAAGFSLDAKGMLGRDAFEGRILLPKVALSADAASGESISAEVRLRGTDRALEAKLKVGDVRGSAQQLAVAGIALELDARAGDASVKGHIGATLNANLADKIYELRRFDGTVALGSPALPQKTLTLPLSGSLKADLASEQIAAEISAKLDDARLQAKLGMTQFSAPRYSFDVDLDRLDIDRYLPPGAASASQTALAKPPGAGAADTPVNFLALKGFEASGRLGIGALTVRQIRVSNIRAQVKLAGGRLDLQPLGASLYGGTFSGSVTLDANGNRIAVRQDLSDAQIGPLVRDLTGRDALEGRGRVSLDVEGAGASVNAIRKSLSGSARLALRGGAVKGIDLADALRKARPGSDAKSEVHTADTSRKTEFSEFAASFTIRDGIAHNEDLAIKTAAFRIAGAGDIDLGASKLDYTVKASVFKPSAGQEAGLARVAGLTLPVRIAGPFDAVKFDVDFAALVAGALKTKIGEKAETLRRRAGSEAAGAAREKLRGLLKR